MLAIPRRSATGCWARGHRIRGRTLNSDARTCGFAETRFVICDRDRKRSTAVGHLLETSGVRVIGRPSRAPNCNHESSTDRSLRHVALNVRSCRVSLAPSAQKWDRPVRPSSPEDIKFTHSSGWRSSNAPWISVGDDHVMLGSTSTVGRPSARHARHPRPPDVDRGDAETGLAGAANQEVPGRKSAAGRATGYGKEKVLKPQVFEQVGAAAIDPPFSGTLAASRCRSPSDRIGCTTSSARRA